MKIRSVFLAASAACMLAGCGEPIAEEVSAELNIISETISETSVQVSEQTEADTKNTDTETTTVTTEATTVADTSPDVSPPEDIVMLCRDSVEVYSEITLNELITETSVTLKDGDMLLDTDSIGEFEIEVPYIYEDTEFTETITYTVADTEKPLILNGGWSVTHKTGTPFDLGEYVGFADNYDRNPVLTYTGTVDPDTAGSYDLTATVTDSSGNSTSWDLTVKVSDSTPDSDEDTNTRVSYSDFIAKYDGEGVRFGIDVSAWQGSIDYNAVKEAGCSFVIMRIGRCYGEVEMDKYFKENIEGASAAGLDVGVYLYSTDNTVEGIKTDAAWIAEQLDGRKIAFPVVFDWEDFGTFQEYGMNIHDLNGIFEIFAAEMEGYGYSAMLYSSKNFLNNFWSEKVKNDYPVWLAHYTSKTDYDGAYAIWQASAYGRIPGIDGDVDMDILYADRADFTS